MGSGSGSGIGDRIQIAEKEDQLSDVQSRTVRACQLEQRLHERDLQLQQREQRLTLAEEQHRLHVQSKEEEYQV